MSARRGIDLLDERPDESGTYQTRLSLRPKGYVGRKSQPRENSRRFYEAEATSVRFPAGGSARRSAEAEARATQMVSEAIAPGIFRATNYFVARNRTEALRSKSARRIITAKWYDALDASTAV